MYWKNVTRTHQIDGNCNIHLWVLNYLKLERNERDKRSNLGETSANPFPALMVHVWPASPELQEQLESLKSELEVQDADVEQWQVCYVMDHFNPFHMFGSCADSGAVSRTFRSAQSLYTELGCLGTVLYDFDKPLSCLCAHCGIWNFKSVTQCVFFETKQVICICNILTGSSCRRRSTTLSGRGGRGQRMPV